jgi:hypothetical protein
MTSQRLGVWQLRRHIKLHLSASMPAAVENWSGPGGGAVEAAEEGRGVLTFFHHY